MSKPNYIIHFDDVEWSYYSQINVHHIENKHGIRMYPERMTKHNPPREMCKLVFPGEEKLVYVYVKSETIDGVIHHWCTPVNKRTDKRPGYMADFKGNLRGIRGWQRKKTAGDDLSQAEGT